MNRRLQILFVFLVLLASLQCAIAGGELTSIRSTGMAGTSGAVARGIDAIGSNPANLDLPDSARFTMILLPISVRVGSNFMTYDLYNRYFTGVEGTEGREPRYLTNEDKQSILAAFPDGLGTVGADAQVRPIGIAIRFGFGTLGLSITEKAVAQISIPREYVQFLFYGNIPGSVYDFSKTSGVAAWQREYSISFATGLPDLGFARNLKIGVTAKLVHGYGYAEVQKFDTRLATGMDGVLAGNVNVLVRKAGIDVLNNSSSGGYAPFPAPAGSGVGMDLGVSGDLNDYLRAGISVTDIGSVQWTRNTEEGFADSAMVIDDPMNSDQRHRIENLWNGQTRPIDAFTTHLPTTLRLGVALDLNNVKWVRRILFGEMVIAADYIQGLYETMGSTTAARGSLGLEYMPWRFLPLRVGYAFGGSDGPHVGLGFGLHAGFFDLDFASDNAGWVFSPKTFAGGSFAMGMKVRL